MRTIKTSLNLKPNTTVPVAKSQPCAEVRVECNKGKVYVGDKDSQTVMISAGNHVDINASDAQNVYVRADKLEASVSITIFTPVPVYEEWDVVEFDTSIKFIEPDQPQRQFHRRKSYDIPKGLIDALKKYLNK